MKNEFESLVEKLRSVFRAERKIEIAFFILALVLKIKFGVPLAWGIFAGLILLFLSSFLFGVVSIKLTNTDD